MGRTIIAGAFALGAWWSPGVAAAFERQWHLGAAVGYALAGFPDAASHGFGGGAYATYGITDAFNLRVHFDASIVDIPDPGTSALIYNPVIGAEYVFDTLQWVFYSGVLSGPAFVDIQKGDLLPQWAIEIPLGLNYALSRSFGIGFEAQYRLFLLGADGSPVNNLWAGGRFEYTFGY